MKSFFAAVGCAWSVGARAAALARACYAATFRLSSISHANCRPPPATDATPASGPAIYQGRDSWIGNEKGRFRWLEEARGRGALGNAARGRRLTGSGAGD